MDLCRFPNIHHEQAVLTHHQILEGLATIIFSLIAAIILPADISSAKFLSAEERAFARESSSSYGNSSP